MAAKPKKPRASALYTEHIPVRFEEQMVKDVKRFADAHEWKLNHAIRVLVRRGLLASEQHLTLDYEPPREFTTEPFEESP